MNRKTQSLFASLAVLTAGLAVTSIFMFAFVANAEFRNQGPHAVGSKLELAITDSGRVIVRGAEIVQISSSTITARTTWGTSAITWTVNTNTETDFVTKGGSGSDLESLSAGDYISFSGQLNESASSFTVDADAIRNWSLGDVKDSDLRKEARAEAKADAKTRWADWKNLPFFNWFKEEKDSR